MMFVFPAAIVTHHGLTPPVYWRDQFAGLSSNAIPNAETAPFGVPIRGAGDGQLQPIK